MSKQTRAHPDSEFRDAVADTINDVVQAVQRLHFASLLAWRDITSSVRLTLLGPLWLLLQPLLWIVTIVFFFGPSAGRDEPYYGLYVSIGLTLFFGLQTAVVQGSRLFAAERAIILSIPLPYFVFVFKLLMKVGISIAISSLIILAMLVIEQPALHATVLLVIPALAIYGVAVVGIALTLGVIGTKYIDLHFGLQSLMRVVMFATPIFWIVPHDETLRTLAAHLNPIYHLIEIVRAPLMGRPIDGMHWAVSIIFAVATLLAGIGLFTRYRKRLALWI